MICEFDCMVCGAHVRKRRSPANVLTVPKYCSQRCHGIGRTGTGKGQKANITFACATCGKVSAIYRSPGSHRTVKFCSLDCLGANQRGERNPSYSGGRHVLHTGYAVVLSPDHPNADARGYVLEHRLVMERVLGRNLSGTEVVHHNDGNKLNNDPSNLRLFASNADHQRHHKEKRHGAT